MLRVRPVRTTRAGTQIGPSIALGENVDVRLTRTQFNLLNELIVEAWKHPGRQVESDELVRRIGTGTYSTSLPVHYSNLKKAMAPESGQLFLFGGRYGLTTTVRRCSPHGIQPSQIYTSQVSGVDHSKPPFVGPQPFSRDRVREFFGRNAERDELVESLQESDGPRVIIIHSRSGAGKTSLINASLYTELTDRGFDVLPVARLGVIPSQPNKDENPYTWAAIASMGNEIRPQTSPLSYSWKSYLATYEHPDAPRILIIDQLEEILTMLLGKPSAKRDFFVEILDAIAAYPSLRVVLAIREEFLVPIQRLAKDLEPYWSLFPLEPLQLDAAIEAITGPAGTVGVTFDRDVAAALVDELAHIRYKDILGQIIDEPSEFVEPLHLQVVCQVLWRQLPSRIRKISWAEIQQVIPVAPADPRGVVDIRLAIKHFVSSALEDFCGDVTKEVAHEADFPMELLVLGCQRFVSKTGTRSFVPREATHTGALPNSIVEQLANKHLLRVEDRSGSHWYELAHDKLIQPMIALAQQVDICSLEQVWDTTIHAIATDHADEVIDETELKHQFCRTFISSRGAPIRAPISAVGELPSWAIEVTSRIGLIRQFEDQQEEYYELSHLQLATALHQIHQRITRDPGPLYDIVRVMFSSVISIIMAIIAVMTTRSLLQGFHLTLTQASGDGFVNGAFQGIIGAIDWGVFIAGGLASWWYLGEHCVRRRTRGQALRATFVGALAGMVGGILVTANLLYAQSGNSLQEAGWILERNRPPMTAFIETGFGFSMIILGIGLGTATGFSVIRVLCSLQWNALVRRHSIERTLSETVHALRDVLFNTIRQSWYTILPIMALAAAFDYAMFWTFSNPPALHRIIGEALTIAAGGFALTGGLLFGIFALRGGLAIPAPEEPVDGN